MNEHYHHISETSSTNQLMKELIRKNNTPEGFVVQTDYQTRGKGQGNNSWESAKGKNLLFSLLLRPQHIAIEDQFIISQIVSLGILKALSKLIPDNADSLSIKWPNDIYLNNKKLGGILIENTLQGRIINASVIGIGLNVNQEEFYSDARNPVSLKQITGIEYPVYQIMNSVITHILHLYLEINPEQVREQYMNNLYRRSGYHNFRSKNNSFSARILDIASDGKLMLESVDGEISTYYFKEVEFSI
jgi:BirA family biotin operon repressor/biotin-[acetyl-CoA-carboxylase] ligase